jgi:hypothetical protein
MKGTEREQMNTVAQQVLAQPFDGLIELSGL